MSNKSIKFFSSLAACSITISAFAQENYLSCAKVSSVGSDCSFTIGTLPNSTAAFTVSEDFPLKNLNAMYTVVADFPCGRASGSLGVYATADGGKTWGGPIIFNQTVSFNLFGNGPLVFEDKTQNITKMLMVTPSCALHISHSYILNPTAASAIVDYMRNEVAAYNRLVEVLKPIDTIVVMANILKTNITVLDPAECVKKRETVSSQV